MGQNTGLTNDIIQQTELQMIPGILLLLDFQFEKHSKPWNGHLFKIPSTCSTLATALKLDWSSKQFRVMFRFDAKHF